MKLTVDKAEATSTKPGNEMREQVLYLDFEQRGAIAC